MLKLKVPDASCGHCAAAIETAVRSVDSSAEVEVDLINKTASITSVADPDRIREAVRAAGYNNAPVAP